MKLSFTLFILPLVAAAAQDGNLRDSSPVETANAAADRHHLRRVLTVESVQGSCKTGDCSQVTCPGSQKCQSCNLPCPCKDKDCVCALPMGYECVNRSEVDEDVDGSILEEE
jgi:hypothetical protein